MTDRIAIGAHLSIKKGYAGAAREAMKNGMGAFQYFPKNPRGLSIKQFEHQDAELCRQLCQTHNIVSVAHTPYPSNLAVDQHNDPGTYNRVVSSLRNDMEIAEACGSIGIVVHFGTIKSGNPLQGYQNIIQCINDVLDGWQGNCKLLLENQAGNHGDMGMTMEEMVSIRKLCISPEHIGYCLDTCHAFTSGLWDIERDQQSFWEKGEGLHYWGELSVIHLNDSKEPALSRRDRHARVGEGHIGEEGFKKWFQMEPLRNIPLIFETEPGQDGTYNEDMCRVKSWMES